MSDSPTRPDDAAAADPRSAVADPLVGGLIEHRYSVERRLARGGMATVYVAHDVRLGRRVAVKVMHPHLAEDQQFIERFDREARSAARISHPAVVTVNDQGMVDGRPFLVMDLVSGPTLRRVLRREGSLPLGVALQYTEDVLSALRAAMREHVIHRDIKPENVLIPAEGPARVTDFGLARAVSEASMSLTNNMLGTVAYMAPEIATSDKPDSRSDVYSVGIMLWEMLTGHTPWSGENALHIAYKHVHEDVPSPSSECAWIPSEVDDYVAALTARDPHERIQSAEEAIAALVRVRAALPEDLLSMRSDVPGIPDTEATGPTMDSPTGQAITSEGIDDEAPVDPNADHMSPAQGASASDGTTAPADNTSGATADAGTGSGPEDEDPHLGLEHDDALQETRIFPHGLPFAPPHVADSHSADDGTMPTDFLAPLATGHTHETQVLPAWEPDADGHYPTTILPPASLPAPASSTPQSDMGPGAHNDADPRENGAQAGALTSDKKSGRTPRRSRGRWVLIAVLVLGLLGGAGSGYWWWTEYGPGSYLPMPVTESRPIDDVRRELEGLGVSIDVIEEFSDTVPAGQVITSVPKSAGSVHKYATVKLTVSKGVDLRVVPDLVGLDQEEATAKLSEVGLKLGSATQEWSEDHDEGIIIKQATAPHTSVRVDSPVNVVFSKGPEPMKVPNLVGMTQGDAVLLLADSVLSLEVTEAFSDTVPAGTIISQETPEGTVLHRGDDVKVTISKGPELIAVPGVLGLSRDNAVAKLEGAGFKVEVSNLVGGFLGLAHSTDPVEGSAVPKGSTVTLYLV